MATFTSADILAARAVLAGMTDRIEELRRAWAESTGDNPDDYVLSEDDWSFGLGDDDAAELVALLQLRDDMARDAVTDDR